MQTKFPPLVDVPKGFIEAIRIPGGRFDGELAAPCHCGRRTALDGSTGEVWLVLWKNAMLMFVHEECVNKENVTDNTEDDDA